MDKFKIVGFNTETRKKIIFFLDNSKQYKGFQKIIKDIEYFESGRFTKYHFNHTFRKIKNKDKKNQKVKQQEIFFIKHIIQNVKSLVSYIIIKNEDYECNIDFETKYFINYTQHCNKIIKYYDVLDNETYHILFNDNASYDNFIKIYDSLQEYYDLKINTLTTYNLLNKELNQEEVNIVNQLEESYKNFIIDAKDTNLKANCIVLDYKNSDLTFLKPEYNEIDLTIFLKSFNGDRSYKGDFMKQF